MYESVIIAGSGGQGILFVGTVLAQAGIIEGKEVTFFPSYGAEIRGGTANCTVILSDSRIGSPIVQNPSSMILLNLPSFQKFLPRLKQGGRLIINESLISEKPNGGSKNVVALPVTTIAEHVLYNVKVANLIALGAYIKVSAVISPDSVEKALDIILKGKDQLIVLNKTAFKKGLDMPI